jgi:large subunit ribosomal protein L13
LPRRDLPLQHRTGVWRNECAASESRLTEKRTEPGVSDGARQTTAIAMKTFSAKPAEVTHEWFVLDATDKVLGRVASEVALRLRGKHKAIYTPHVDTGDFIVVVNADKIRVTGNKANDKVYYSHSGFPGGIHAIKFKDMQAKHPGRALEKAVKGMLPKGPLGYAMVKKLKVYAGASHPHTAQQPKVLEL